MELDFEFLKKRGFGELIGDFIALFKRIAKHFHGVFLTLSLPFIAVFMVAVYFATRLITEQTYGEDFDADSFWEIFFVILGAIGLMFLMSILISGLAIEYTRILFRNHSLNFGVKEVFSSFRRNFPKYLKFFFYSILVMAIIIIPFGLVYSISVFLPIIGGIINQWEIGVLYLFFYFSFFAYLDGRTNLLSSASYGFRLLKAKFWGYTLANFIFMFVSQVLIFIFFIAAIAIFLIVYFNTLQRDFDMYNFFNSVGGKITISIGGAILMFFTTLITIYQIVFMKLIYYSAIEERFGEAISDEIEKIGTTKDEF